MQHKRSFYALVPILAVILIDSMGLGLVYPILNISLISPTHSILIGTPLAPYKTWVYGAITGIFSLTWLFGATYISQLSDQIGRKKSLLICLMGSCVGYIITGIGIGTHSLILITLGRAIDGFTAGSQPVAQACAVDLAPPYKKTQYLSAVVLVLTLGFIIGPLLSAFTINPHYSHWFRLSTPMYLAAGLCFINLMALLFFFKETFTPIQKKSPSLFAATQLISQAFKTPSVQKLSLYYLLFTIGWASFYTFIGPLGLIQDHLSTSQTLNLMIFMGIGFTIGNTLLIKLMPTQFSKSTILAGLWITMCPLTLALIFNKDVLFLYGATLILGSFCALSYTYVIDMYSELTDKNNQGLMMGISNAIVSLAFTLTQFAGGPLMDYASSAPMIVTAFSFLISGILIARYQKKTA